jgi:hypothetical protein
MYSVDTVIGYCPCRDRPRPSSILAHLRCWLCSPLHPPGYQNNKRIYFHESDPQHSRVVPYRAHAESVLLSRSIAAAKQSTIIRHDGFDTRLQRLGAKESDDIREVIQSEAAESCRTTSRDVVRSSSDL